MRRDRDPVGTVLERWERIRYIGAALYVERILRPGWSAEGRTEGAGLTEEGQRSLANACLTVGARFMEEWEARRDEALEAVSRTAGEEGP